MPEVDPNGLNAHDPGAKLDDGKLRYSLIPTGPLKWLAKLYTVGAAKYSDHGWKAVLGGENRYLDALMRHLEKYREGEWLDTDTKVPHIIAVAWNAFAICWVKEEKPKTIALDPGSREAVMAAIIEEEKPAEMGTIKIIDPFIRDKKFR